MEQIPVESSIVLYQADGRNVPVEVTYENETFWMSQKNIAELFNVNIPAISKHLNNIYQEGELEEKATISKMEIVQNEGTRTVKREVAFYNLDAIIAVGYRVNSIQATRFRQWATTTLREYIIKGFVLNDDMLKNGRPFGKDYFDELLVRIRDIRASERRVWQKVTDLFQDVSSDYDKTSVIAREFYSTIQNKMHYAATGQTAAELILSRADSSKEHMGLTTWNGAPDGRIHSSDVTVGKNYLSKAELEHLNSLVVGLLDAADNRARNHQLTTMQECVALIDKYLQLTGDKVLTTHGSRSKKQADKYAREEFRKFNERQKNDFERFIERVGK